MNQAWEGAGGRIAIIASTTSWAGTVKAYADQIVQTSPTGGAGTIFIKMPGTNGTLIIDNNMNVSSNTTGADFSAAITSADYSSTFDQIQLRHGGRLLIMNPSTFTITASSPVVDGLGSDELRVDGKLNTPASLTVTNYTLTISTYTRAPSLTYLDIGANGFVNIGGTTQAPVVNLSSITIENSGTLTHWYNLGNTEDHKLNLSLSSMTINAGGKIDVTTKGYPVGTGPGAATCSGTWAGGSYGGQGYNATPSCSGPTYGTYNAPVNLGSGGYEYAGGGAVILNIAKHSDGKRKHPGGRQPERQSVPGLRRKHLPDGGEFLVGSGTISANASNFGSNWEGSGGRIAIIASTTSWTGAVKAYADSDCPGFRHRCGGNHFH